MANKYGLKQATLISMAKAFNYFQLCICYMAAYYFSVRLFLVDDFDPRNIAMILSAQIIIIYRSIYMLSTISDLFMATDSACRVMQFLDSETSYSTSTQKGFVPDTFEADVSFRNVHFSYPTNIHTKVLHDLTLNIEPGKVTAVVGASGAGKSTIVGLTLRLYDVTAGQEPILFDTSIEENIRYGKTTATLEEIIKAAKISYAHDFIEKLPSGYGSIVGEGGIKLSGGQKQRIAIARAMVRKPKLLLLDEATSALDSLSEGIVQKALDNAMHGRTTLIIAHRLSTVRKADVIYVMNNGCVVEKGSHSDLMKLNGYYYSLVKVEEQEEKERVCSLNMHHLPTFPIGTPLWHPFFTHLADSRHHRLYQFQNTILRNIMRTMEEESDRNLTIKKKNLKVIVVWLLAVLFTTIISTFLPVFYYIFSLFCEGVMSTMATRLWLEKLQNKVFTKLVSMDISWFDRSGNSPNECLEILTNCPPLIESVATEYVQHVKTIQLLNCQQYLIDHYQDLLMLSKREAFVSIIWYALIYGMSRTLIRLSTGMTFVFEANDIASSKVRGTLLISIMSALSFTSMSAGPIFILMSQYPQARQAMARLYRVASTKSYINKQTDEENKPEIFGNIVFKDVMFSYPTRDQVLVLKNLNLEIKAGTTVALVGDSGCGKSTIISLLERFYLPNSGKILFDGTDINSINVAYLRSQMGLVSQEPALFDMTIKENILYGLEEDAYDTPVGERGSKLSGGQKQRIAIARAVLRNPKILLLDEFTSALDTESEKVVQEALEKASVGKTTILIAHRLSTVCKADKIVVLHSGVVVEEGTHQQLLERKGYYFNLLNR
ncbi:unnamed protein product [Nezara viridula]|uniref:ABC-type xenobiotic transporter n=1 Tax=Nezara viridula TaxID=85310 RepID=A0A9P0E669_NEZVI|nr:unnamed protein product [Nezara viridula]